MVKGVFFKEFMMESCDLIKEKEMELIIAQPSIVDGKLLIESNVPTLNVI